MHVLQNKAFLKDFFPLFCNKTLSLQLIASEFISKLCALAIGILAALARCALNKNLMALSHGC
jgi:hypothetical protein